jgi:hypothetical protein
MTLVAEWIPARANSRNDGGGSSASCPSPPYLQQLSLPCVETTFPAHSSGIGISYLFFHFQCACQVGEFFQDGILTNLTRSSSNLTVLQI